jgi:periplasmic divalent cation tolerance protein
MHMQRGDTSVILILSTAPRSKGRELAQKLVAERLVACVNIVPVASCFRWKGSLEQEDEDLLIMKTVETRSAAVLERVRELHPYELPEIIVLNVAGGFPPYLAWVGESVQ